MRILVVERSDAIRARLVVRLRDAGFVVVAQAATADAALPEITKHAPDVVLMDVHLRDRSPLDGIHLVRAQAPVVCIVVLSNSVHFRDSALASGADHFFDKSTELDAAIELISRRAVT